MLPDSLAAEVRVGVVSPAAIDTTAEDFAELNDMQKQAEQYEQDLQRLNEAPDIDEDKPEDEGLQMQLSIAVKQRVT